MSAVGSPALRTLAFGDPATGMWGLIWSDGETVGVFGTAGDGAAEVRPAALLGTKPDSEWRLESDGLALSALAAGSPSDLAAGSPSDLAAGSPPELPSGDWAQLCQVSGRITLAGTEREFSCAGLRSEQAAPELPRLDSFRQVLAWFAQDDGIALASARPQGASGHERDEVTATVFEPEGPRAVEDGRLSTTYAAGGAPTKMSLELWLAGEEEEFPRRAAGEVIGAARAELAAGTLEVNVLRCHRGGRDGLGTYVIARPR